MERFEHDELEDRELDTLLGEWKAPPAPARLRAAVFLEPARPWWRRFWSASIRIPVPVACCLAILLAAAAWRFARPVPPQVVVKTQQVEVYRDRIVLVPAPESREDPHQLKPVAELRPRIIRSRNVQN